MAVDRHAMLHGGIAQLGERLNGIQEVRGSTPLISTSTESGLLSVDKSSDFCLYRIRRPYFPEDLPLPIACFRLLLGNLYAKQFSDFSGNPLLFYRMCAIILALHRGIAQLVEYRSPKPWVAGSNPPAPAMLCGQNPIHTRKTAVWKAKRRKKREISKDFSRFFDPAFFRSFIDPFCPFRCCVRTRTHEKGFFASSRKQSVLWLDSDLRKRSRTVRKSRRFTNCLQTHLIPPQIVRI